MKVFDQLSKLRPGYCLLIILVTTSLFSCAPTTIPYAAHSSTNAQQPAILTPDSAFTSKTALPLVTKPPASDVIWKMIEQVNKDRALTDLRKLTGEEPICNEAGCYTVTSRKTGSEGLSKVKDYVSDELVKAGYSVERNTWSTLKYADQNLIAKKQGVTKPDELIYLVAHLDAIAKDKIQRYPGADDDASGAVDILELARVISRYSFERTIVLFFSTGEEQGRLGAESYLNQLSSEDLNAIKYVIDVDMVGYDANGDGASELWHGDHAPSKALSQTISDVMTGYDLKLTPILEKGCG